MMKSKKLKLWQKFALGVSTGLGVASRLLGTTDKALRILADLDTSDKAVARGYVIEDLKTEAKNAIEELKLEYKASDQDWTYGYDGEGRRLSFEEFIYKKYGLQIEKSSSKDGKVTSQEIL